MAFEEGPARGMEVLSGRWGDQCENGGGALEGAAWVLMRDAGLAHSSGCLLSRDRCQAGQQGGNPGHPERCTSHNCSAPLFEAVCFFDGVLQMCWNGGP